jgi:hypothetical protein
VEGRDDDEEAEAFELECSVPRERHSKFAIGQADTLAFRISHFS